MNAFKTCDVTFKIFKPNTRQLVKCKDSMVFLDKKEKSNFEEYLKN